MPDHQNGLVRIISQKRYLNPVESIAQARDYLRDLCAVAGHVFWPDDLSVREEAFLAEAIESASRVTDAYLLALAVHHGGQLVTIDRRFASIGVVGGQSALKLLND